MDLLAISVIVLFFLINIIIGFFVSKKLDIEGYFIANRKLGLFQSVMTISGTFIGAMTLLVYTAFVFTFGISAIWMFIGFCIGFIIFSFFAIYLKKHSKGKKFYTMTDYFKFRFGKKVALAIIAVIFIWYFGTLSAQFIGGGKVLMELTSCSFEICAVIMCAVILFYLILGGFKSVVQTDVFQFIILGLIICAMAFILQSEVSVPLSHFNPFNAGIANIIAFLMFGILTPFATQDYWQRIFAMKDIKTAKRTFIISGFLVLFISIFLTYIGLVARTVFTNIDPDTAAVYGFTQLVPPFLVGFVAIAFFAAILSTADTFLFLLAVNFTNDILGMKDKDPRGKIKYTRIAIIVIGVLALALALVYQNIVGITIIFKSIGLSVAPIVILIWFTKGNRNAIISTVIISTLLVLAFSLTGFIKPELALVSIIGGFLIYGLAMAVSKIVKSKTAKT